MKVSKHARLFALTVVFSLSAARAQCQTIDSNQIWQGDGGAIVRIDVSGTDRSGASHQVTYGNGVIIDPKGTIITALHVVGQPTDWQDTGNGTVDRIVGVTWRDKNGVERKWQASVREIPTFDVAVLSINADNLPSVPIGLSPIPPFSNIALIFWDKPQGSIPTIPRLLLGHLTTADPGRDGPKITIVASVVEGNSGAPVFNAKGELVAIVTNEDEIHSLALAIPVSLFVPTFVPLAPQISRDAPATAPENAATKLSSFIFFTPPNEYKAGSRKWTRIAPDRWQQEYPDGTKQVNLILKRINFRSCNGSVVYDPITSPNFQAFLPDKGCLNMMFFFRQTPTDSWTAYVQMTDVK
jgi:hypothetical protein